MPLNIVADENIPFAGEAFSSIGTVTLAKGRAVTRDMLLHADALAVRSVTKVNEALLAGTAVKYVTTATIGYDHIDRGYLDRAGIGFASAPGSNANSVSEYITSAILAVGALSGISWRGRSIGIIGVGNVGSIVAKKASALGLIPVLNDPPLAESTGDAKYRPIDEALECDIITIHTPLEKGGAHPTYRLANASFFQRMKRCTLFINSSRGKVTEQAALRNAIKSGHVRHAVLDVFDTEPNITPADVEGITYSTPHIAGYSYDGKVNGTAMNYASICAHFGIAPSWDFRASLPRTDTPSVTVDPSLDAERTLWEAVRALYDIRADDKALRGVLTSESDVAKGFDRLRKEYRVRREFMHTRVTANTDAHASLRTLGFIV
ncbi:MAG: 4-phosphoerythronate dehydrogenase [Spirochaetota bacterium]